MSTTMRRSRTVRSLFLTTLAVGCITAVPSNLYAEPPVAELRDALVEAQEQYAAAAQLAYQSGTGQFDVYLAAKQDWLRALRKQASDHVQQIALQERLTGSLLLDERRVQRLHDSGAHGGEEHTYRLVQLAALLAERELIQIGTRAYLDPTEILESAVSLTAAAASAYGVGTLTLDDYIQSLEAALDAELAVVATSEGRQAACLQSLEHRKTLHHRVTALHEHGARGGEAENLAQSRAALLDAQIRLAEVEEAVQPIPNQQQLRSQHEEALRDYVQHLQLAYEAGTRTFEQLLRAHEQLSAAQLALASDGAQRGRLLDEHVMRLDVLDKQVRKLATVGARGGEATNVLASRIALLKAQLALAEHGEG